ncbi:xanthine dehydrogenase family protein molybdopterin-binding subunit [Dyadobacter psychrotolerans]|uniref:Xanthine dehydrogenase family protein molybdopterin-binding subunit n=1 Tax=Dyadobacter psychrotolerans TaxID=2541721 RepID=A0A4R5DR01_9BACT|nr:xanthine dehydrogenase family protein molybdopterin-binding subunit [Dyadobacter psychrotolerans]TDE14704.1 xanthine dehydrogenase family protein molybdopterin-binding subunit [Dyadobacter psychrotolerans]
MSTRPAIGQPISRLEGHMKVTGAAKYAGEYNVPGLLYGYVINSTITKGKIISFNTEAAKALPGVIEIFTHENRPSLAWFDLSYADMDAPPGSPFRPLYNAEVSSNGQPIGLVVAETFELARYAATLMEIQYEEESFRVDLKENLAEAHTPSIGMATMLKPPPPKPKGDFEEAFANSYAQVSAEYFHGTEHHNPMELFATTTIYEGDGKLTIYDKTQGTINSQLYVGNIFGLHFKDVRVISPYVGGAFGSGLRPQYQLFLSVMAALELKRPVRVTLDRSQMFTFGHRPQTVQYTRFGTDEYGKIIAMNHKAIGETSKNEDYTENVVNWANMLYASKNTLMQYELVDLDVFSPLDMRAPGGSTGSHAIESTMDELSYKLKIDPMQLRLINYSEKDDSLGRPYSSKELRQCYLQGAERFGWAERNPEPRSMRRGNKLIGYGMATGIWEANHLPARAEAIIDSEGKLQVSSAVTDIGTGMMTIMAQIAADELGLPVEDVAISYGDSKMPFAPIQGGSFTTSTIGSAIKAAGKALRKKLFKKAKDMDSSIFSSMDIEDVAFRDGKISVKDSPALSVSFKEIVAANKGKAIKTINFSVPKFFKLKKYSRAAHSAVFVEVEVDEQLGVINVTRAVTAVAAGRIINPKTARSQILGGMVWSVSKALREETITDYRLGKYMNQNLGEYHIPVHADIHDMDVIFVEEKDENVNELGTKGVGEIGLVGMPPAIANAVYHATGKRINQFPIHFDSLL